MRKVIVSQLTFDILNLHNQGIRGQELFEKSGAKTRAQFKTAYGALGIENLFEDTAVILQIRGTKETHIDTEVAETAAVEFTQDAIENNEAELQSGIEHYYDWSERKGYLYDDLEAGATTEDIDFFFGGRALADMAKKSKKPFLIKALTTSEKVKDIIAPYCRTLDWDKINERRDEMYSDYHNRVSTKLPKKYASVTDEEALVLDPFGDDDFELQTFSYADSLIEEIFAETDEEDLPF